MISTVHNSSFGKVMLESIKNFVHRGVGGVHPPLGSPSWAEPPADTPPSPTRDGHCSGRYASYWNAFLLNHDLIVSCFVVLSLYWTAYKLKTSKLPLKGHLFSKEKVNLINTKRTCLQIYFDCKLGGTSKGVTARNRVYCIRRTEGSSSAVKVELIPLMTEV